MKECRYSKYCGGCSNLKIDYDEQLNLKSKKVEKLFVDAGISCNIPKTIGMYYPYGYRNKVHLAFKEFKRKTIIGFYEEGSSKVIDIEDCLLHADWLKKLIVILKEFVKKYKIIPYDALTKTGTIRYACARVIENSIMLTLVTTTKNFAGREYLFAKLSQVFKNVSLYININKRTDNLVFDDKGFSFVKGQKYLQGTMLGIKYNIAPNSFLQVNNEICKTMYQKVLSLLDIKANDNVLDLYSGIGITSILFAKKCSGVVSIEYNTEATKMAEVNKKLNKTDNLKVLTGPCEKLIDTLDLTKFNKVFLDPARMGAEVNVIKKINEQNLDKIVYMSCDPETLVRDIKLLTNYKITFVQTYDMFPQTNHIETLVLLAKKSVNDKV